MSGRWQTALGFALTGCELELAEPGRPDPVALVSALEAAGWPADRMGAHARSRVAAELPWPHDVPADLRAGCGAAQFAAALRQARELLDLANLEVRPPSGRRQLNADELRLMRDVPPHHGS
ncbi:MAG: hypothetical protein IT193_08075 [Propionibacteriaceae bacterium]|nr:hypothetical protein [Propionibacteriaceae bacterium]